MDQAQDARMNLDTSTKCMSRLASSVDEKRVDARVALKYFPIGACRASAKPMFASNYPPTAI
jgi:hypothetical protein